MQELDGSACYDGDLSPRQVLERKNRDRLRAALRRDLKSPRDSRSLMGASTVSRAGWCHWVPFMSVILRQRRHLLRSTRKAIKARSRREDVSYARIAAGAGIPGLGKKRICLCQWVSYLALVSPGLKQTGIPKTCPWGTVLDRHIHTGYVLGGAPCLILVQVGHGMGRACPVGDNPRSEYKQVCRRLWSRHIIP